MNDLLTSVARLVARKDCVSNDDMNTCEKPVASSHVIVAVVLSVGLFVFTALLITLFWLHLRRRARDRKEDEINQYELAEYGLEAPPQRTEPRRFKHKMHLSFGSGDDGAPAKAPKAPKGPTGGDDIAGKTQNRESLQPLTLN